jgi:hypothetical protein
MSDGVVRRVQNNPVGAIDPTIGAARVLYSETSSLRETAADHYAYSGTFKIRNALLQMSRAMCQPCCNNTVF